MADSAYRTHRVRSVSTGFDITRQVQSGLPPSRARPASASRASERSRVRIALGSRFRHLLLVDTRLAPATILAIVLCLPAEVGLAQTPPDDTRARIHFQSGREYFDAGDYEAALREFEVALENSGRAELHYNLSLCHERLGAFDVAAEHLGIYLREVSPPNSRELEQRLAGLRQRASLAQHDAASESNPSQAHWERTEATLELGPPEASHEASYPISMVGFGVAAAGLVSVAVFGAWTLAENERLSRCKPGCAPSATNTIAWTAPLTDASFAIALAGAVVGVVGFLLPETSANVETGFMVRPWIGRELGAEGSLRW